MNSKHKQISKYLSLILRHNPEKIGLKLDDNGWASVTELLSRSKRKQPLLTIELLREIVMTNDKQRFSFKENETKIRANQGHSIKVTLGYDSKEPPAFLFHGTVGKFIPAIKEKGILKMSRHHVHLSHDRNTAAKVGARRGIPIILTIRARDMYRDGIQFYQSENGVWLTDHIPSPYIEFAK